MFKYFKVEFWLRNVLIPGLLTLPVLSFAIPAIFEGTENIEMIRHFDQDEVLLVEFAGRIYSKGLTPFEYGYPHFFYYLGGIFLVPYTFLKGLNYQVIAIALRTLNLLAVLATIIFLYFFCLRFFKSIFVAVLSCALFITTPEYLWWVVNCRPHPLEIFFILLTFYFCFQLVKKYQPKIFVKAVISAGMAASVKYGGIFMIPVIWIISLFHMVNETPEKLAEYIKSKYKLIYSISGVIATFIFLFLTGATLFLIKHKELLYRTKINGLNDFLRIRDIRIFIIFAVLTFSMSLTWVGINKLCRILSKNKLLVERYRYWFIINKSFLFFCYIVISMSLIFLLSNPTYWIFPVTTAKSLMRHFTLTTMGTNVDLGLNSAVFDLGRLVWFKMLFDRNLLGVWIGMLLGCYIFYEIIFLKRNWKNDKFFVIQRGNFWIYIFSLMSILFIFVSHRPHHYLLPIVMVAGVLTSFGIVSITKHTKSVFLRWILAIIFIFLLILGFCTRIPDILFNHKLLISKKKDTGLIVGSWLEDNYGLNTTIWKDDAEFYIPPEFNNVYSTEDFSNINKLFKQINVLNPDILIITNENDPDLNNIKEVNRAIKSRVLKGYKLMKIFKYQGYLTLGESERGKYKEINIYQKI